MSVWDVDSIVNVDEPKPKDVVNEKENVAISFVTVELENEDGRVVCVHEEYALDLILHCLLGGEHVPPVSSSKASHWGSFDALLVDIFLDRSAELDNVDEVNGGEKETANEDLVV